MILSMVNSGGLVNNTRNRETCFEAGFTVSDFSFSVIKSIALISAIRRRIQQSDFSSITTQDAVILMVEFVIIEIVKIYIIR